MKELEQITLADLQPGALLIRRKISARVKTRWPLFVVSSCMNSAGNVCTMTIMTPTHLKVMTVDAFTVTRLRRLAVAPQG